MKTSTKIIVGIVLTAGVAGTVFAVKNHHFFHGGPEARADWIVERVSDHLDLTAEQNAKLNDLKGQILELRRDVMQDRKARRAQFKEIMTAQVMDQQRIIDLIQEKTNEVNLRAPEVIASIAEFTDSLTPEQKTEIGEMMEHKFQHHDHGHGFE